MNREVPLPCKVGEWARQVGKWEQEVGEWARWVGEQEQEAGEWER